MEFSDIWSIKKIAEKPVKKLIVPSISWMRNDMGEDNEEVSNYFSYMDRSATRDDYKNLRSHRNLQYGMYAETNFSKEKGWGWAIQGGGEWPEILGTGRGFKSAEEAKTAASKALQEKHAEMLDKGWIHLDNTGKIADPEHPYHFPEPQQYMCTNCEKYITERPDRFDPKTLCPSCGQVGSFITGKDLEYWGY